MTKSKSDLSKSPRPAPPLTDPLERLIAEALDYAEISYITDFQGNPSNLDFKLTESGIEIEVKRFYTPRIADQMARADNVIAIQGLEAAKFFAELIRASSPAE